MKDIKIKKGIFKKVKYKIKINPKNWEDEFREKFGGDVWLGADRKTIEEFNNWCKENKITIGLHMKSESIRIADWWIIKFKEQKKEIIKEIERKIEWYIKDGDVAGADVLRGLKEELLNKLK